MDKALFYGFLYEELGEIVHPMLAQHVATKANSNEESNQR